MVAGICCIAMKELSLVFPHQLFATHPALDQERPVYLIEEHLFFTQFAFHKQQLIFRTAAMQHWMRQKQLEGFKIHYVSAYEPLHDIRLLIPELARQGFKQFHLIEPDDDWLNRRIETGTRREGIGVTWYASPGFLCKPAEWMAFFNQKASYFQSGFYIEQRRRLNLLMTADGQPLGGKWSFDTENRKRFPANGRIVPVLKLQESKLVLEAREYVQQQFPSAPGSAGLLMYPVTAADAKNWLLDFLEHRFNGFGIYEDAIVRDAHVLHHSVLSPLLNTGLLLPREVLDAAIQFAANHEVPMNSLEGFVRQIAGWREFVRLVYLREGRKQRTTNFWNFTRKIPASFYQGTTGILPVDAVLKKVLKTGYAHHIERLMVLGNFMLLCEFDPDEVYRWFMELFIDSADWVMVPNVYGMSQFADGGLMTTKPYISGSNYLLKMSDFPKGSWTETWDALFWRFMHVHRDFFTKNPRLGMLVHTFDRMPPEKQQLHLHRAEQFLNQLDENNRG